MAAVPAPAGAVVRDCNARVDFNLYITSARDMSCGAARFEMRRHRGSIARRFRTPNGFSCYRVRGTATSGQWRCVKGGRAFRFRFAD